MAAYRIPKWAFGVFGLGATAGAIYDSKRRSSWVLSGGLGMAGMIAWNLYVEARTIESVVEQGYVYGQAPVTAEEEMSGKMIPFPRPPIPPPHYGG